MSFKKYALISTLALLLGTSSFASANSCHNEENMKGHPQAFHTQHFLKMVPEQQRAALKEMMEASQQKMMPLIKEDLALKMQLRGLLTTPGMQWVQINKILDKMNANHAEITMLMTKNQFEMFKKFGILPPPLPERGPGKMFVPHL